MTQTVTEMLEVSQTGFERYLVEIQTIRMSMLGLMEQREWLAEEAGAGSDAQCASQLHLAAQLPDAQLLQTDRYHHHGDVSLEGMQFALRRYVDAMTRPGTNQGFLLETWYWSSRQIMDAMMKRQLLKHAHLSSNMDKEVMHIGHNRRKRLQ